MQRRRQTVKTKNVKIERYSTSKDDFMFTSSHIKMLQEKQETQEEKLKESLNDDKNRLMMSAFRLCQKRIKIMQQEVNKEYQNKKYHCIVLFVKFLERFIVIYGIPIFLFFDQITDIYFAYHAKAHAKYCWLFIILPTIIGLLNMVYWFNSSKTNTPEKRLYKDLMEANADSNCCIQKICQFFILIFITFLYWSRLIYIYDSILYDQTKLSQKLESGQHRQKQKFYKKYSSSKTNKGRAFLIELIFENIPQLVLQYIINSGERGDFFQWTTFEQINFLLSVNALITETKEVYEMLQQGESLQDQIVRHKTFIKEYLRLCEKSIYFTSVVDLHRQQKVHEIQQKVANQPSQLKSMKAAKALETEYSLKSDALSDILFIVEDEINQLKELAQYATKDDQIIQFQKLRRRLQKLQSLFVDFKNN